MIFVFGAKILRTKNLSAKILGAEILGAEILGAKAWWHGYDNRANGHKGQK
jgi:hypothetical protein